jgi:hypothetical protein
MSRADTKITSRTEMMQPTASQASGSFNSHIQLISTTNFKLAVTFSKVY